MDSPLEKILNYNGYVAPEDFITETVDTLDNLDYPNDAGTMVRIFMRSAGLLKSFKQYVAFQAHQGTPINVSSGWYDISLIDFNKYWTLNKTLSLLLLHQFMSTQSQT